MEYAAYFDDSGHPDDQDCLVVAGFVASEEQWRRFEETWRRILDPLKIDPFHMTEFEASTRWSRREKDEILYRLVRATTVRAQFYIAHVVNMSAYREINAEFAFEQEIGTPYALAGRTVARSLNEWKAAQPGTRDKLLVVFEDGTKHKGDLIDVMQRDGLPCPAFRKKHEGIPLQAADLLAWEVFNCVTGVEMMRPSLDKLTDIPGDEGEYGKDALLEMCAHREPRISRYAELPKNTEIVFHTLKKKARRRTLI